MALERFWKSNVPHDVMARNILTIYRFEAEDSICTALERMSMGAESIYEASCRCGSGNAKLDAGASKMVACGTCVGV